MNHTTQENLLKIFMQYADSNRRCFAYARKAQDTGCPGAARFFKALTRSYSIQAANMLRKAGCIQTNEENLKQILIEEREMRLASLPDYIGQAKSEGSDYARIAFEWSQGSGENLENLFEDALEQMEQNQDCRFDELHVCSACGYLVQGEAPDSCPNCKVNKKLIPAIE